MDANLETILGVIDTFGTIGLLVYLVKSSRDDLKQERASHEATRRDYREDLRDMANLRQRTTE